ncbi:MAG: HlyD family secretion protein, partial [Pseudomonadota bacterium]
VAEIDAALTQAGAERAAAQAQIGQAEAALAQVEDELGRKRPLAEQGSAAVSVREIETLENSLAARQAALAAAEANLQAVVDQIEAVLPAQKASAEAALHEAEIQLGKTLVTAGVDGTVEQFTLQVGDFVSALLRPAGILVPSEAGRHGFQAGFGQISAQVLHPGMVAEITCAAKPFTVIPMVITEIQDVIAAGQIRPSDLLLDASTAGGPGMVTVFMEPLYDGGIDGIPPGSSCIANAYSSHHEKLEDPDLGFGSRLFYHVVDTVGVVHAGILRSQAIQLPVQTLVLQGH